MFDLKRPCVNCPFRRGQGGAFRLDPGRLEEIRTGSAFQCHKTVDYSAWEEGGEKAGDRPNSARGSWPSSGGRARTTRSCRLLSASGQRGLTTLTPGARRMPPGLRPSLRMKARRDEWTLPKGPS